MSFLYRILAMVVTLAGVFLIGFIEGHRYEKNQASARQAVAQAAAVTRAGVETTRRESVAAAREVSSERIRGVYRTIRERAVEYEPPRPLPKEEGAKAAAGTSAVAESSVLVLAGTVSGVGCGLDAVGLQLWNEANRGVATPLRGESDRRLPNAAAREVGGSEGFVAESRGDDGVAGAVRGQVGEIGVVQQPETLPSPPLSGRELNHD